MTQRSETSEEDPLAVTVEDNLDIQLKDAGLWEEGLSLNEKKQLFDLIRDSKDCAKEEESKRQRQNQTTKDTVEQKKVEEGNKTHVPPIVEDSDPVITFESPSTKKWREMLTSTEKGGTVASENTSPKDKPNSDKENSVNSLAKQVKSPTLSKGTLKQINSLFSNTSITVQYASPSSAKGTTVMVSETDEDSDEHIEPVPLKDRILNNCTNNSKINSQGVERNLINTKKDSQSNGKNEIINTESQSKYTLNASAVKKALLTGPTNSRCHQKSSKRAPILNIEHDPEIVSEVDSPELINSEEASTPNCVPLTRDKVGRPNKKSNLSCFVSMSHNDVPLKKKVEPLSEKQSEAYFKAPYETETKCVKRIYSLISDWQLALAEYQRKIPRPCKWGLPINVDRQIKVGLLKKSYVNKMPKFNPREPTSGDTSDSSFASDSQVIERNDDDDWQGLFLKKRRRYTNRKLTKKKLIVQNTKKANLGKLPDVERKENQSEIIHSDGKTEEKKTSEEKVTSIPNSQTINETEMDQSQEARSQPNSQNVLPKSPCDPPRILQILDQPSKSNRKCFDLAPDPVPSKPESQVPELETQPNKSAPPEPSTKTKNLNDTMEDITLYSSSSSEEATADGDVEVKAAVRGGIKRKNTSTPFNTPPLKKAAANPPLSSGQAQVAPQIRPTSIRMRGLLSKKTYSKVVHDKETYLAKTQIPQTYLAKTSMKKPTIIEATLSDPEEESNEDTGRGGAGGTGQASNPCSSQTDSPATANEGRSKNNPSTTAKSVSVECPLCQSMFLAHLIEGHASECNGPPEVAVRRKKQQPNVVMRNQ